MLRSISRLTRNAQILKSSSLRNMSIWANVKMGPPDPILGVAEAYRNDPSEIKVNLSVGAFRDDNGKPFVLKSVRKAEKQIMDMAMDKEYIPISGLDSFNNASIRFAYGPESLPIKENRIAVAQSLSGTGALRVGAAFIERWLGKDTKIFVPKPTWGNHITVFRDAGLSVSDYKYLDSKTNTLDIAGVLEDFSKMPKGSVVLLHGCAHNPTGVDPSPEQWKQILEVCKQRELIPFFDLAYQGFASGNPEKDAYSLRLFTDAGMPVILAQSYAKNMGLYGERVGAISFVCKDEAEKQNVLSQMKILIRPLYSNPPSNGVRIASKILNDPELNSLWLDEVKYMADRIISMRTLLRSHLENDCGSKLDWSHITSQIGMFCFTGVSPDKVQRLRDEFHIYLTSNGRISIPGANSKNVKYIAESFHQVTK
ncbi:hypothetical protein BB558_000797 [Smittium angustum]|uniref:Aspartate aminotransferase n=1 Tax=Smittium angustum TaxID=133377 RepID=A0A2U1IW88_SMIAN|nr:hypothetical protein BB558_006995 [Smittium angustum]PWA03014.1 hypothetical protein BB558_000797 [Smittium angustum]